MNSSTKYREISDSTSSNVLYDVVIQQEATRKLMKLKYYSLCFGGSAIIVWAICIALCVLKVQKNIVDLIFSIAILLSVMTISSIVGWIHYKRKYKQLLTQFNNYQNMDDINDLMKK
ncbi:Hypothetical_protein [Hexamita inflata]|uniref:Hypothetical_protein n=1 Tax=Hexamita inflata TaxID=28002 RepID=A0AA86RQT5_9EUKA|nr:Hypothetical protein HINF_LOCUS64027 [Hexamita inflata]